MQENERLVDYQRPADRPAATNEVCSQVAEGKMHKHECKHCRKIFYCDWDKKHCDRPLCYPCNAKRVKMKAEGKERDFWFSSEPEKWEFRSDSDDEQEKKV